MKKRKQLFVTVYILFFLNSILKLEAQQIDWNNKGILYIGENSMVTSMGKFINYEEGEYLNYGNKIYRSHVTNYGLYIDNEKAYTTFEAGQTQNLRSTRPMYFQNIIFNLRNYEKINIYSEVEVYGQVAFKKGIVNTRNNIGKLTFHPSAMVLEANQESYVDGFLYRIGNDEFEFPLGNEEQFRPLRIYGNSNRLGMYSAVYHFENSNTYFSHSRKEEGILKINTQEFWEIYELSISSPIYISLPTTEQDAWKIEQFPNAILTIVAWDSTQQKWKDMGGVLEKNESKITTTFKTSLYGAYTTAIKVASTDELEIYNAINPKDTGGNDFFRIDNITLYPNNEVQIFDSRGIMVYQTKNYASFNNVFTGITDGNIRVKKGEKLPTNTYFYVIKRIHPETKKEIRNIGYLYLKQ